MSPPHLPDAAPRPLQPRDVVPLGAELGSVAGHRLVLLSLERWDGWGDLRFARIDLGDGHRLSRRVPPAEQWRVLVDGEPVEVFDAVGRGDRWFSNGEVRIVPCPPTGSRLDVEVVLTAGAPPLTARVQLPR